MAEDEDKTGRTERPVRVHGTVENAIKRLLTHNGAVQAGHVYCINLRSLVMTNFRSPHLTLRHADQIAREIIEELLSDEDQYLRHDDGSYFLLFPKKTQEAAELKARVVSNRITRALQEEDRRYDEVHYSSEVQEFHKPRRKGEGGSPLTRTRRRDEVGAWATRAMKKMVETDTMPSLALDDWLSDRIPPELVFHYRPLWHVSNNLVTAYVCSGVPQELSTASVSKAEIALAQAGISETPKLDAKVLARVIQDLRRLEATDRKLLLVAPVHYSTLTIKRHASMYFEMCRHLTDEHKRLLVFEVLGVPKGAPLAILEEKIAYLRRNARAVLEQVTPGFREFSTRVRMPLHAVGLSLATLRRGDADLLELLDRFADNAQRHGLKTYVHGVPSRTLMTAAVCSGFDYIDGEMLSSLDETPSELREFSPRMIYADLARS